MKRYLIVGFILLCAVSAYGFQLIGSGVVSAPASGQNFSDSFTYSDGDLDAVAGSYWTEIKGDIDIVSGVARQAASGSCAAIWDTSASGVDQYMKVVDVNDLSYQGMLFRYTDASNHFYVLEIATDGTVSWYHIDTVASWTATQIGTGKDIGAEAAGSNWAVTVCGTGADTVVNAWLDVVNDTPYDCNNWDGASDPPAQTWTDDPGANAVDTGNYVGIDAYNASANQIDWDNWYAGDTP